MSWNPRRMVDALKGSIISEGDPHYFWLTSDAVERVRQCAEHQALWHTEVLPVESLVVGLGAPIRTAHGEASLIAVPGVHALKRGLTRMSYDADDPSYAEEMARQAREVSDDVHDANRTVAVYARNGTQISSGRVVMPDWNPYPPTKEVADEEMQGAVAFGHPVKWGLFYGDDALRIVYAIRAAWTLLNEPEEREVTATTVTASTVTIGKRRKARDIPVQVVDVRRPRGSGGSSDTGDHPLDHEYRWQVKGYFRMQPYGPRGAVRRKTWIDPHVRGPEDKPIKPRVERVRGQDIDGQS